MKLVLPVVFLICCQCVVFSQDTTCGIVWYPGLQVSIGEGGLPKIAVTGDTVHIIWRGSHALRLPYARSTNGGISFEPIRELLPDSATYWRQPSDAQIVTTGDTVLICFVGANSGTGLSKFYVLRSSNRGGAWQPPVTVSSDSGTFMTSISAWSETVAVMRNHKPSDRTGILRTEDNMSWSTVYGNNYRPDTRCAVSPSASSPLLHLANVVLVGGLPAIEHRRSSNLGTTWFDSTIISSATGNSSIEPDITAGLDDSGRVRVFTAWRDNKYGCAGFVGCSIIGRQSLDAGITFSPETLLTEYPTGYGAKIALAGDNIAVVWNEEIGVYPHPNVRVSRDGGLTWCPVVRVAPNSFNAGNTRVAVSRTGIHVVWMQNDSSGAPFYIYYRHGIFLTTGVEETQALPQQFLLSQNFPNPFNPSTRIAYRVGSFTKPFRRRDPVSLSVYDVLGQEVATLVNEQKESGEYSVTWNAEGLPSGVYYYRLIVGDRVETKKAVLIR